MTQYPNEKDPHSNWVYPAQQGQNPYTSRDGAPGAPAQPQGYDEEPEGPPPAYGYADYESKGPVQASVLAPPPGPYSTAADASPSTSSTTQEGGGGHGMSLGSFFGNRGPPPSWQRQAPPQLPYGAFPPMCLISNGHDLSKGFPELPPPCQLNPHPFATHDITEEDWKRFLADVKRAGSLSPAQRIKSNVIPMVTGMSLVTGFIATFAIEKRMKYKNRGAAGDLVDHWNHYFFGPRRMEVVLCQASERLSGKLGTAPVGDPNQARMARKLRQRSGGSDDDDDDDDDDNDDDDSSGEGGHQSHGKLGRRAARHERRQARRARRAERRARRARGENKEPYELYLTAVE